MSELPTYGKSRPPTDTTAPSYDRTTRPSARRSHQRTHNAAIASWPTESESDFITLAISKMETQMVANCSFFNEATHRICKEQYIFTSSIYQPYCAAHFGLRPRTINAVIHGTDHRVRTVPTKIGTCMYNDEMGKCKTKTTYKSADNGYHYAFIPMCDEHHRFLLGYLDSVADRTRPQTGFRAKFKRMFGLNADGRN